MLHSVAHEGLRILTLDRPQLGNALDVAMVSALQEALEEVHADKTIHTLVLRAEGKHFCTGFDLSDLEQASDGDLLHRFVQIELLLAGLWHAPVRTVAFAQGRAWGAGADLFACCDLRVAQQDSSFCFPGVRFGLVLGTRRLASRIGEGAALSTVSEGRMLGADEALAAGLVSETCTLEFATWLETLPVPVIDRATGAALKRATRAEQRDADLAALVRSAARPGLRDRIAAYRSARR